MPVATRESRVLWRFFKGHQEACCVLRPHPTAGMEVLYVYNGVHLIGVVSTDIESLRERAGQWRLRLVDEGWTEGERPFEPAPLKVRQVGVA